QVVTTAPAARWWTSPAPLDGQRYVEWADEHGSALAVSGARGAWSSYVRGSRVARAIRRARSRPRTPQPWLPGRALLSMTWRCRSAGSTGERRSADGHGWHDHDALARRNVLRLRHSLLTAAADAAAGKARAGSRVSCVRS